LTPPQVLHTRQYAVRQYGQIY